MLRKLCLIAVFALIGCSDDKGGNNASENNMASIEPRGIDGANEELRGE